MIGEISISDSRVYVHGAAATPVKLVEAMTNHGKKAGLRNVEIMHIHTEGPGTYHKPEFEGTSVHVNELQILFLYSKCIHLVTSLSCYLIRCTTV